MRAKAAIAIGTLPLMLAAVVACGSSEEPTALAPAAEPSNAWRELFNGVDLAGWTPKLAGYPLGEDPFRTFRVEEGLLRVSYAEYSQFEGQYGHLFFAEPFSDYRLRLEYRFHGDQMAGGEAWAERNSGVMFHAQSPKAWPSINRFRSPSKLSSWGAWVVGRDRPGISALPGTHVMMSGRLVTEHCVESSSETYDSDTWVRAEIEVRSDRKVKHVINGETVLEYEATQIGGDLGPEDYPLAEGTPLGDGYIALQAESHPIDFRAIELLVLPAERDGSD